MKCEECGESFESTRALASHSKAHQKSVPCPLCKEPIRYLGPHLRNVHSDDPLVQLENGFSMLIAEVRELRAENAELRGKI